MSKLFPSLLAFGLVLAATPALATPPLSDARAAPLTDDEIIVTATRTPQRPSAVGASVSVIDQATLTKAGAAPVVDVLRDVPGVSFSRNGGIGGVATVRIRGAESDQTVVLIDGVKVNDPSQPGGGFNFATLMIGDLDRIEVLRGPQSTLYGSQAIGGVINLITREPTSALEGDASVEVGELQARSVRAAVRGIVGDLRYALSAGRFEGDGISAAATGRERDSFENTGVQARARYDVNAALALEARAWWSSSDVGIDGFPAPTFALADTPERTQSDEQVLYAAAKLNALDGRWRTTLSLSQSAIERDNLNPALVSPVTFSARGVADRVELQSVFDLSPQVQIVAGAEQEMSEFRTRSPALAKASADISAVYAQVQAAPIEGLTATFGIRGSDHDRFGDAVNMRATVAWAFNNGDTIVRVAAADGFKAPTLFQLFSDFGNVTLQPEEASSVEVGVEQSFFDRSLVGAVTWFDRSTTNQIDFISCFGNASPICAGRPFGTYDNIARTTAEGVEATLAYQPTSDVSFAAGYTTLTTRNTAAGTPTFGRRLPRRPEDTAFVSASWRVTPDAELSATWSRIGDAFDNASNTRRLRAYSLLTLRGSLTIAERWSLYARVENAGDETYETTSGYGSPPRQAFVGLRAAF